MNFRLQQKVFMDEVRQQMILPTIRSYLKLYTSMPMDKLAKYMCTPNEVCTVDALESNLLCFKHKMMNLVWTSKGTSGLEGEFQAESEVSKELSRSKLEINLWDFHKIPMKIETYYSTLLFSCRLISISIKT